MITSKKQDLRNLTTIDYCEGFAARRPRISMLKIISPSYRRIKNAARINAYFYDLIFVVFLILMQM
jgi:hypothetical protein